MWLFSKPKPEDDLEARVLKAAATLVQSNYRGQLARRQSSSLRHDDPLLRAIARRGVDARGPPRSCGDNEHGALVDALVDAEADRDLVDALVDARAAAEREQPSRSASSLLRENEEDMERLEVTEAGRLNAAASKVQAMHRGSLARLATQKALIDGDVHAADAYVGAKRGAQRRTAAAAEARRDALERAGLTAGGGGRSRPTAAAAPATSEELASFRRAGGSDGGDFLSRLAALEAKYETYDATPPA